jgi:hypothetical protein
MAGFTDGYETIAPAGQSPGAAPGTEKTNESRPSPGPGWSRAAAKGATPGRPTGGGGEGTSSDTY